LAGPPLGRLIRLEGIVRQLHRDQRCGFAPCDRHPVIASARGVDRQGLDARAGAATDLQGGGDDRLLERFLSAHSTTTILPRSCRRQTSNASDAKPPISASPSPIATSTSSRRTWIYC